MEKNIITDINHILKKSKYIEKLKKDEIFLIDELSKLDKHLLKQYLKRYNNKEKINKIRFYVIDYILKNNSIDIKDLEKIKIKINNMYNYV